MLWRTCQEVFERRDPLVLIRGPEFEVLRAICLQPCDASRPVAEPAVNTSYRVCQRDEHRLRNLKAILALLWRYLQGIYFIGSCVIYKVSIYVYCITFPSTATASNIAWSNFSPHMVLAASTSTSSVTDAPAPIIDVGFYGNLQ